MFEFVKTTPATEKVCASAPMRLRPDEWRSGEILWLFDVVGESAAAAHLMKGLRQGALKDRPIKARRVGSDGRILVGIIAADAADNANHVRAQS